MVKNLQDLFQTIIFAGLVFLALQFSISRFVIDGVSMEPTLSNGDSILVSGIAYAGLNLPNEQVIYIFGGPRRGDIVVFGRFTNADDIIKRIIAVPGDTILIRDGGVFVNGQPSTAVSEGKVGSTSAGSYFDFSGAPIVVPQGQFFVLGDNRSNSLDSRHWGFLDRDSVIGPLWQYHLHWNFGEPL